MALFLCRIEWAQNQADWTTGFGVVSIFILKNMGFRCLWETEILHYLVNGGTYQAVIPWKNLSFRAPFSHIGFDRHLFIGLSPDAKKVFLVCPNSNEHSRSSDEILNVFDEDFSRVALHLLHLKFQWFRSRFIANQFLRPLINVFTCLSL